EAVYGGHEAIKAARAYRPEIILLDIRLAGMDGFEVAGRIQADKDLSDILIVAMSAYNPLRTQGRRPEAIFSDYLVKPVDHGALLGIVWRAHWRRGEAFEPQR